MANDSASKPAANTGRFAVLTNPVRGFAERAVGRAWPGRRAKNPPASAADESDVAGSGYETPAPSFVTSEVISAFHLQQLNLPSGVDRVTRGAATGGKVAIVISAFALVSLIGLGLWVSSPNTATSVPSVATTPAWDVPQANTAELEAAVVSPAVAEATAASEPRHAPENVEAARGPLSDPKQRRWTHPISPGATELASTQSLLSITQTGIATTAAASLKTPAITQPERPLPRVPRVPRHK